MTPPIPWYTCWCYTISRDITVQPDTTTKHHSPVLTMNDYVKTIDINIRDLSDRLKKIEEKLAELTDKAKTTTKKQVLTD